MVPGQRGLPGLPRPAALARRVLLPGLRTRRVLADRAGPADVQGVSAAHIGHRRHDLPPNPDPALDLVRRDLVPDLAEERDVRARPAGAGACGDGHPDPAE